MNKISNYFGVFVLGLFILIAVLFAIYFTIKMFINIYKKLRGIRISNTMSCRTCRRSISNTAIICPYCGDNYGKLNGVTDSIVGCFFGALISLVIAIVTLTESLEWFERTFMN